MWYIDCGPKHGRSGFDRSDLSFVFLYEQHIEIITERETGMDKDMLNTIEEKVQEAVREAIEEKMDDFSDSIAEELDGRLQDIIEEAVNDSIIEFFF